MKRFGWFFVLVAVLTAVLPIAAKKSVAGAGGMSLFVSGGAEVYEIDIEEYTLRVLISEAKDCQNEQALYALAVAVRSCAAYFSLYGLKHESFDVCTSGDCCFSLGDPQKTDGAYLARLKNALDATKGEILMLDGMPAMALFTACAGSGTRYCAEFPYLSPIASAEKCEKHASTVELGIDSDLFFTTNDELCLVYGENEKCEFGIAQNKMLSADELVTRFSLPSYEFSLEILDETAVFHCRGLGHGCGLDICASDRMAKSGFGYKDILLKYFPNLSADKIYNN